MPRMQEMGMRVWRVMRRDGGMDEWWVRMGDGVMGTVSVGVQSSPGGTGSAKNDLSVSPPSHFSHSLSHCARSD
jgi:hypothetical protein